MIKQVFLMVQPLLTMEQLSAKHNLTEGNGTSAGLRRGYYYISQELSLPISCITSQTEFTPLSVMKVTSLSPITVEDLCDEVSIYMSTVELVVFS